MKKFFFEEIKKKLIYLRLIFINSFKNHIIRNSVSNFVAKIWSAGLNLLFIPFYLRQLGSEAYGLIALYSSFEVIFAILDLGLSATVNREIARNLATRKPGIHNKNLLKTFEYFYWGIGFFIAIIIVFLSNWITNNWVIIEDLPAEIVKNSIRIMAILFAMRWPRTLYMGVCGGLQKQSLQNIILISTGTLRYLSTFLIIIHISNSVLFFLIWQSLTYLLEIILLTYFSWKELSAFSSEKPTIKLNIIKNVWKFAISFNLVGVLGMILSSAGSLLGSKFVNLSQIGYYSIASTAAGSLTLISYSIGTALSPSFAGRIELNDIEKVSLDYHSALRIINYFTVGFCLILIFFPRDILFWWTRDWEVVNRTYLLLLFLSIAGLFNSIANPSLTLLIASGNTKIPLFCNLFNVIVFIPTLIFFLPKYGIITSSIVWAVENIISFVVYTYYAENHILKGKSIQKILLVLTPSFFSGLIWLGTGFVLSIFIDNLLFRLFIILFVTIGYFLSFLLKTIKHSSIDGSFDFQKDVLL